MSAWWNSDCGLIVNRLFHEKFIDARIHQMKRTVIVLKRLYNFLLLNPFRFYNIVYLNPFFEEIPKSCIQCTTKNWTISSRSSGRHPMCKYNTSVAIYRETRLNKQISTVRSRAKTLNPKHYRWSFVFELPVEGEWDRSIASESFLIAWTSGPPRNNTGRCT
jgi:hypothetical protein